MRIYLTLLTGFILLQACNNSADNTNGIDTVQSAPGEEEEISETAALQQSFPSLFTYLQSQDSSFAVENFIETEMYNLPQNEPFPVGEELKAFSDYLIYNSDSSLALDLYSNNYLLRKRDGREIMQRGEPDTEIVLVDSKKNTEQRLLFTGPSVSIMDAKWISLQELMIAGAEEIGNRRVKPVLWKVNLSDSTVQLFSYPDTVSAKTHLYAEEKIKQLKPAASLE